MYEGAVGVGEGLFAVEVLEELIEAVFAGALERVAHKGRGPAEEDAAEAFFGEDCAPCGDVGGVDLGVDLAAAFDEVEGRYPCVSRSWGMLRLVRVSVEDEGVLTTGFSVGTGC